jgi:membrane protein involved in colicin uptake
MSSSVKNVNEFKPSTLTGILAMGLHPDKVHNLFPSSSRKNITIKQVRNKVSSISNAGSLRLNTTYRSRKDIAKENAKKEHEALKAIREAEQEKKKIEKKIQKEEQSIEEKTYKSFIKLFENAETKYEREAEKAAEKAAAKAEKEAAKEAEKAKKEAEKEMKEIEAKAEKERKSKNAEIAKEIARLEKTKREEEEKKLKEQMKKEAEEKKKREAEEKAKLKELEKLTTQTKSALRINSLVHGFNYEKSLKNDRITKGMKIGNIRKLYNDFKKTYKRNNA